MVAVIRVGQPGSPSKRTSSRMPSESAAWSNWAIRISICCCSSGDRAWSKQSPIRIVPRSTVIGTAAGDHPENRTGRWNRQNAIQAVPDRPDMIRVRWSENPGYIRRDLTLLEQALCSACPDHPPGHKFRRSTQSAISRIVATKPCRFAALPAETRSFRSSRQDRLPSGKSVFLMDMTIRRRGDDVHRKRALFICIYKSLRYSIATGKPRRS